MKDEIKEFVDDFCFNGNFNMNVDENIFRLTLNAAKIKNNNSQSYFIEEIIEFIKKHISEDGEIRLAINEDILEDWFNITIEVKLK